MVRILGRNPLLFVALALLIVVLVGGVVQGSPLQIIPNPGFEGAKVTFHGAVFRHHKYGTDESLKVFPGPFESGQLVEESKKKLYWVNPGQPSTPSVRFEWHSGKIGAAWEGLSLNTEIESHIRLQDLNENGDPLNWAESNEQQEGVEVLQWWRWQNRTEGETVRKELVKQTVYLVPADFIIQLWIPPSTAMTGDHFSGWEEGSWENVQLWFKLYWHNWETIIPAVGDTTEIPQIEGEMQSSYEYKGGYPIVAWIGGFKKNGGIDGIPNPSDVSSSLWFSNKDTMNHVLENGANLVQLTPSLEGRYIDLWSELDGGEITQSIPANTEGLTKRMIHGYAEALKNAPSKDISPTQYFSITLNEFGTYVYQEDWPFGGWNVYYPCVYYRIRILYGVYGTFTYLWTKESAEQYDYTDDTWEQREPTIVYVPNPWGQFLTNPLTWIIIGLIVIMIIGIILAIVAPTFYIVLLNLLPLRLFKRKWLFLFIPGS